MSQELKPLICRNCGSDNSLKLCNHPDGHLFYREEFAQPQPTKEPWEEKLDRIVDGDTYFIKHYNKAIRSLLFSEIKKQREEIRKDIQDYYASVTYASDKDQNEFTYEIKCILGLSSLRDPINPTEK